jgi:hypothetical protein
MGCGAHKGGDLVVDEIGDTRRKKKPVRPSLPSSAQLSMGAACGYSTSNPRRETSRKAHSGRGCGECHAPGE